MSSAFARPIWKERTCEWCGCIYRGIIPQAQTDQAVATAVQSGRDLSSLLGKAKSSAATLPCPGCGAKPHYAVALWRFGFHAAVVVFSIAAAIFLGLAATNRWLVGENFFFVASVVVAAGLFLHLVAWKWNPNYDRAAQQRRGESAADCGQLAVMVGPTRPAERPRYPSLPMLAIPCALISAAAPASAALLLGVEKPPKITQTVQVKEVVVAGDRNVTASWDGGFRSVSGLYKTLKGKVTLTNAAEFGLPSTVEYHLHQDSWSGDTIDDNGDSPGRIQVGLAIPNENKIKGQTLKYRVEIEVEYPVRVSSTQFLEAKAAYTHDFSIRVATDEEAAKIARYNKAGAKVALVNVLGFFAGLLVAWAAVGAWNPGDAGLPVAD
jgi:hypothetical protein